MEKQEERILAQLYHYFQNWLKDQTVGWNQHTFDFKQMHKLLKLQQQSLAILLTDKAPMTVEEKARQASFYVEQGVQYRITACSTQYFVFGDDDNYAQEYTVDYDFI